MFIRILNQLRKRRVKGSNGQGIINCGNGEKKNRNYLLYDSYRNTHSYTKNLDEGYSKLKIDTKERSRSKSLLSEERYWNDKF